MSFIRIMSNETKAYYRKEANGSHELTGEVEYFDNFYEYIEEKQKQGFFVLQNKKVKKIFIITKDEKIKEYYLKLGFVFYFEDVEKAFSDFTGLEIKSVNFSNEYLTQSAADLINENKDIDFSELKGTGKNGKILKKDVAEYIKNK